MSSAHELNEDTPNEDDIVHKAFPNLVASSFGERESVFEQMRQQQRNGTFGPFGPFASCKEWKLAEWLMLTGVSQAAIDQFLKLEIISEDINPSFRNTAALLSKIDKLPHYGNWTCQPVTVCGDRKDYDGERMDEVVEVWFRNPVDCIKELIGNPMFREELTYAPKRLFSDNLKQEEIINEMWTAQWWWNTQEVLPRGATIAPVIISSDKTQLSQFSGDKQAWPVYLTTASQLYQV